MSTPCVYMVQCRDGSLYTGWTVDVPGRVAQHNGGTGARYCARRRPVTLVYVLPCRTKIEALVLEHAIKKLRRSSKLKLAQSFSSPPG